MSRTRSELVALRQLFSHEKTLGQIRQQFRANQQFKEILDTARIQRIRLGSTLSLFAKLARWMSAHPDALPSTLNSSKIERLATKAGIPLTRQQIARVFDALKGAAMTNADNRKHRLDLRQEADYLESLAVPLREGAQLSEAQLQDAELTTIRIVRAAASGLLKKDYGQGIQDIEIRDSGASLVDFALTLHDEGVLSNDLHKEISELIVALGDYDATISSELRLVESGARVSTILGSGTSILSILARLNVFQVAKHLLPIEVYSEELRLLANQVETWHRSKEAAALKRRDPSLPTPVRIASYCRLNLVNHVLAMIVENDQHVTESTQHWLDRCEATLDEVKRSHDLGFDLAQMTVTLYSCVQAKVSGNYSVSDARFQQLGLQKLQSHLTFIEQFEDNDALVLLAHRCAARVFPQIRVPTA